MNSCKTTVRLIKSSIDLARHNRPSRQCGRRTNPVPRTYQLKHNDNSIGARWSYSSMASKEEWACAPRGGCQPQPRRTSNRKCRSRWHHTAERTVREKTVSGSPFSFLSWCLSIACFATQHEPNPHRHPQFNHGCFLFSRSKAFGDCHRRQGRSVLGLKQRNRSTTDTPGPDFAQHNTTTYLAVAKRPIPPLPTPPPAESLLSLPVF